MIKTIIIKALNYFNSYRVLSQQHKAVDRKIDKLKSKGLLKNYPSDSPQPLVTKYPFFKKSDKKWFNFFYSIYGKADIGVLPLSSYYTVIEPCLNNRLMISTIKDKNFYDLFVSDIKTPKVLLRRINGMFYDKNYNHIELDDALLASTLNGEHQIIVKSALFSGSGRSIAVFKREGDKFLDEKIVLDAEYLKKFGDEFVIQQFVKQHEYFRKFNPQSNNTLRVLTYRSVKDDKIHALHSMLRIGAKGSFLDHDNLGGVSVAISDDNKLYDFALDINGNKLGSFNDIVFKDQPEVLALAEVKKIATYLAGKFFHGRLLAMDFTVNDKGEPLLLEINCWGNGISQYQMSSGSVFREYTEEVLNYCSKTKFYNVMTIPYA
jgi:hypothetical protein